MSCASALCALYIVTNVSPLAWSIWARNTRSRDSNNSKSKMPTREKAVMNWAQSSGVRSRKSVLPDYGLALRNNTDFIMLKAVMFLIYSFDNEFAITAKVCNLKPSQFLIVSLMSDSMTSYWMWLNSAKARQALATSVSPILSWFLVIISPNLLKSSLS